MSRSFGTKGEPDCEIANTVSVPIVNEIAIPVSVPTVNVLQNVYELCKGDPLVPNVTHKDSTQVQEGVNNSSYLRDEHRYGELSQLLGYNRDQSSDGESSQLLRYNRDQSSCGESSQLIGYKGLQSESSSVRHADKPIYDSSIIGQPIHDSRNNNRPIYYSSDDTSENPKDFIDNLKEYRANHAKNLIIAYININSIANKLEDIKPILSENYADILVVGETKIDDTFLQSQFQLPITKLSGKIETAMEVVLWFLSRMT
jgi:hypothetical protein